MFGIVINKKGFKVEFVCLNEDKTPQFYELKEDEQVIEIGWEIANTMNKPKWDGEKWVDTEPLPPVETPIEQVDKTRILEDEVATLKQEKQVLAQNVYEIASVLETLITATMQGGGTDASTTGTDTTTEAKTN